MSEPRKITLVIFERAAHPSGETSLAQSDF
jgi:hypothetical protein